MTHQRANPHLAAFDRDQQHDEDTDDFLATQPPVTWPDPPTPTPPDPRRPPGAALLAAALETAIGELELAVDVLRDLPGDHLQLTIDTKGGLHRVERALRRVREEVMLP